MKTCKTCKEEKDLAEFKKDARSKGGYAAVCQSCKSELPDGDSSEIKSLSGKVEAIAEATDDAIAEINEKFDQLATRIESLFARNNPVSISKGFQAAEQDLGGGGEASFKSGDTVELVETSRTMNEPAMMDKLEMMKFLEEPVKIRVHQTTDRHASNVFNVWINGEREFFVRGQEKVTSRKYVEKLARSKPVHFGCEEATNRDGTLGYRYPMNRGLRYPFEVVEDRNPRGREWLTRVLAEPH